SLQKKKPPIVAVSTWTLTPAGAVLQRIFELLLSSSPIRAGKDLADLARKRSDRQASVAVLGSFCYFHPLPGPEATPSHRSFLLQSA
ncbi:hypothetical protein MMC29_001645, partial [Sticta canariensis]|nr:hypothetical protein [Sticta canariensis]